VFTTVVTAADQVADTLLANLAGRQCLSAPRRRSGLGAGLGRAMMALPGQRSSRSDRLEVMEL